MVSATTRASSRPACAAAMPPGPEELRALFGRIVRQAWTPAEIDLLDRAACSAMLEPGPAA